MPNIVCQIVGGIILEVGAVSLCAQIIMIGIFAQCQSIYEYTPSNSTEIIKLLRIDCHNDHGYDQLNDGIFSTEVIAASLGCIGAVIAVVRGADSVELS
jgi:hypothetical protein